MSCWIRLVAFVVALLLVTPAYSDELKHGELGAALYSNVIANDHSDYSDDELSGIAIYGTSVFSRNAALRTLFAMLSHNDVSGLDSNIFELSLIFGGGLGQTGWKGYAGPGFFSDRWSTSGFSKSFSGLHLIAGFGYNWDDVALDAWWTFRDASDYEDFVEGSSGESVSMSAVSFGLGLSARF